MNDFPHDLLQIKSALLKKNEQFIADENNLYTLIREDTAENGQTPYAVVITCADSRVTPEFIFSETIGSLFVIRSVGNIVGETELTSIDYAITLFQPKCIIIMGHTECNAVLCAIAGQQDSIASAIAKIIKGEKDHTNAVKMNVHNSANKVKKHPSVQEAIKNKQLVVLPALYNMSTGKVDFLD